MASINDIKITFEIEQIVKVTCMARTCKYNFNYFCDLKHIRIDEQTASCMEFERREALQGVRDHAAT